MSYRSRLETEYSRRAVLKSAALLGAACPLAAYVDSPGPGVTALIDGTAMAHIPAGEFQMGSTAGNPDELPVHRVQITRPFELSKYETTQAQWESVLNDAHPRPGVPLMNAQGAEVSRKPSHFPGSSLPVENIAWDDVQLFLARLNARDPEHIYRLPTEAEWEYAANAGKRPPRDLTAWHKENSGDQTHPVGQHKPNAWGLYDMQGNVAEWVQDWYGREYYAESPVKDPQGPPAGSYRVFRGGSWLDEPKQCRTSFRGFDFPVNRLYNVGFRVARTPR